MPELLAMNVVHIPNYDYGKVMDNLVDFKPKRHVVQFADYIQ